MTLTNLQCRLAARPSGLPKPSDWSFVEEPVPEPGDGEFLVAGPVHLARPGDARLDERRPLLRPAGGDRRGDARRWASGGCSTRDHPDFAAGDHVYGLVRRAGATRSPTARGVTQGRPVARAGAASISARSASPA